MTAPIVWFAAAFLLPILGAPVEGADDTYQTGRQANAAAIDQLRRGHLDQAEALLRIAVEKSPEDAEIVTNWASVLARLGRREAAEAGYRRALAIAPDRFLAYTGLADLFAEDPSRWQDRERLRAQLEDGLRKVTANPRGRIGLGLRIANFERAVGLTAEARKRLDAIEAKEPLTTAQRERIRQIHVLIDRDEQARSLDDWPEVSVSIDETRRLDLLNQELGSGDVRATIAQADGWLVRYPAWQAARWLRARALLAIGRNDDAISDLKILVRLAPSHTAAWRRLGILLAEHGGRSEMAHASQALAHAMALDPAATDLWLPRARVAVRLGQNVQARRALARFRAGLPDRARDPAIANDLAALERLLREGQGATATGISIPPLHVDDVPNEARVKFREAEEWLAGGDPIGLAPGLLDQALAIAPGFVDAAIARFSLTADVSEVTVRTLWDSADGLLALSQGILLSARGETARQADGVKIARARALAAPWLQRAAALGNPEALFEHALLAHATGDRARTLSDLREYVARDPPPAHLPEADAVRATLGAGTATPTLQVRSWLAADRPDEARARVGGACDDTATSWQLDQLADIAMFEGDLRTAARCRHHQSLDGGSPVAALSALVDIAVRTDAPLRRELAADLERARRAGIARADWPVALALHEGGAPDSAILAPLDRFLASSENSAPERPRALALRDRLLSARHLGERTTHRRRITVAVGLACLIGVLAYVRGRGTSLVGALARRPSLFPEVAAAVQTIRHDVLKHRTSALGLLAMPPVSNPPAAIRDDVARTLLDPEPASAVVAAAYSRLIHAARARGLTLRAPDRDRVFGPLIRDLRTAERLIRVPGRVSDLNAIAQRLRDIHHERLGALLTLGPKTRIDAALLERWIHALRAEWNAANADQRSADLGPPSSWTDPALHLEGHDLDFPLPGSDLYLIFANLLRNAEHAVAPLTPPNSDGPRPYAAVAPPRIVIRVGVEHDPLAGRLFTLAVGDSAPEPLTLETIESRDSGRGLALVRDLTRQWRGHIVIRTEAEPWRKSVGVHFPS